jgi:phosphoribosylglycinamide formyltransferase-1
MTRIAIFASGNGTNAQRIMEYFKEDPEICVALVVSNKPTAFVLERAAREQVPAVLCSKDDFIKGEPILALMESHRIDFIVLAGFLLLIPAPLIRRYPNAIINIHPALLPAWGGKGMYGDKVHQAVIAHGDRESGISIHYVNEHYDEGGIIFQARCPVHPEDTPESLASRIHALEYMLSLIHI